MNGAAKWAEVRVGNLGQVFTGRTPSTKCPEYFGNEFFFITPGDMHQVKHVHATERRLSGAGAELLRRIQLPPKSICVSCIGWQMGEVVMTSAASFTNQQINSIVANGDVDADFLYYSFLPRKQELLSLGSAIGVRTPILNKSGFCELRIMLPPLPAQRRIAGVLSAYDDLIENNTRRIEILDEMAQAIYREWFVNLRFPGHEKVKTLDSPLGPIPEGWELKPLGELVEVVKGKKPNTSSSRPEPGLVPYLLIDSLRTGGCIFTRPTGMPIAEKNDIVMVMDGGSSGQVFIGSAGVIGSTLARFTPRDKGRISPYTLFLFLRDHFGEIADRNVGSAIPHANKEYLSRMLLPVATANVTAQFHDIACDIYRHVGLLSQKNRVLRQTRDLLLPKLISGEVDVSELDIDVGGSEA